MRVAFTIKSLLAFLAVLAWVGPSTYLIVQGNVEGALQWSGASVLLAKMAYDWFFTVKMSE